MIIVGLDLSLTGTGICTADACEVLSVKSTGIERLADYGPLIADRVRGADLVVIEGYSFGSKNSQAHALGELGGTVRLWCYLKDIPWVDVPPTVLKKFATGKGNANKDDMVATAARLGCPVNNNNAVDAWWLRQMGLYGYPHETLPCDVPRTAYRDEACLKVEWPGD